MIRLMRLILAPINPTVGDMAGNAAMIIERVRAARASGADLVVFPELAVSGYPPRDLLLQEGFMEEVRAQVEAIVEEARGVTAILGAPWAVEGAPAGAIGNALLAIRNGRIERVYFKRLLPEYDVFDELRYFLPGEDAAVIEVGGARVGLSICEDLWGGRDVETTWRYAGLPDPLAELKAEGVDLIVNASASPFALGKNARQRAVLSDRCVQAGAVIATVNQFGATDHVIHDGWTMALAPDGRGGARVIGAGEPFGDEALAIELPEDPGAWTGLAEARDPWRERSESRLLWDALTLGVRDYARKTGFEGVVLGLSGGIDSSVTACVAAGALGAENVLGIAMPSRHSSAGSRTDAAALAERLGAPLVEAPIETTHRTLGESLAAPFGALEIGGVEGVTDENLQSRIRGTIVMAFANRMGRLALSTGNKSELAVGYCTLYGDMNGALAVLADVSKGRVYALAEWINERAQELGFGEAPIPSDVLTKPPSAELAEGQLDEDSLPAYAIVDEVVERYVERRQAAARIVRETEIEAGTVSRLIRLIDTNEFKRRQAAMTLKVTDRAFGMGRRMPIAQGWRPDRLV